MVWGAAIHLLVVVLLAEHADQHVLIALIVTPLRVAHNVNLESHSNLSDFLNYKNL